MKKETKGTLILVLTAFVWGTGFIAQKFGNDIMPPISFNAIRQMMAAIVLWPVLAINLKRNKYLSSEVNEPAVLQKRKKNALLGGLLCGIFLLLGSITQQVGLLTVSVGKSGFITALYIVMTPLVSIVFGKRVKFKTYVCIAIALAGFAALSLKGGLGGTTPGDWLTLISAAFFAIQIVLVNHFVDDDNDIMISVLEMTFCGIIGLILAFTIEHPSMESIIECMPVLLYSTFFPTAMGFTLQIVGQKHVSPTAAALAMSLESVFAALLGVVILGESMAAREIIGCILIFAAVILEQLEWGKPIDSKQSK